jgi:hypothetical protein
MRSVELGICTQVRCRQVQGDASFALDLRKRLELYERWNIDVKHRALTSQPPRGDIGSLQITILMEAMCSGIDGRQRTGQPSTQAKSHIAANPIKA